MDAAVVPPEICVLAAVLHRLEGQDGDRCLLTVAISETQILHCRLLATVRTGVDVAACPHLCRGTRIEHGFTLDAFS